MINRASFQFYLCHVAQNNFLSLAKPFLAMMAKGSSSSNSNSSIGGIHVVLIRNQVHIEKTIGNVTTCLCMSRGGCKYLTEACLGLPISRTPLAIQRI